MMINRDSATHKDYRQMCLTISIDFCSFVQILHHTYFINAQGANINIYYTSYNSVPGD